MVMTQIRQIAKKLSIRAGKSRKTELIRKIQIKEGNLGCFNTQRTDCHEAQCCWKEDCDA